MDQTKATIRYMIDDVSAAIDFYTTQLGFVVESEALPAFAVDRLIAGFCSLWIGPNRLLRSAITFKPSTLLNFHRALVQRKYRLLFSPKCRSLDQKVPTRMSFVPLLI